MKKLVKAKRTGKWVIENYPPNGKYTLSYMHEIIEETWCEKKGKVSVYTSETRYGRPVYLQGDMTRDQQALFVVAATAMNALIEGIK